MLFGEPSISGDYLQDIAGELENNFIEICRAIHNYSFDVFAHRVTKCECHLAEIREYIA